MSRYAIGLAAVLALVVAMTGCQKLPGTASVGTPLPAETLTSPDAIPAAWGNLVGTSAVGDYPDLVQLWFQDEQKAIRVVVFRPRTGEILHARLIRRN